MIPSGCAAQACHDACHKPCQVPCQIQKAPPCGRDGGRTSASRPAHQRSTWIVSPGVPTISGPEEVRREALVEEADVAQEPCGLCAVRCCRRTSAARGHPPARGQGQRAKGRNRWRHDASVDAASASGRGAESSLAPRVASRPRPRGEQPATGWRPTGKPPHRRGSSRRHGQRRRPPAAPSRGSPVRPPLR